MTEGHPQPNYYLEEIKRDHGLLKKMKKEAVERDKYAKEIGRVLAVAEKVPERSSKNNSALPESVQTMGSFWAPHHSQVTHVNKHQNRAGGAKTSRDYQAENKNRFTDRVAAEPKWSCPTLEEEDQVALDKL